jgi:hypothetical protein
MSYRIYSAIFPSVFSFFSGICPFEQLESANRGIPFVVGDAEKSWCIWPRLQMFYLS